MLIKKIRLVLSLTLVLASLLALFISSGPVYAAISPGCYDRYAGDQLLRSVECPADKTAGVDAGKCYIGSIQPKVGTTYAEFDCNSIDANELAPQDDPFRINPAGNCNAKSGDCITNDIQIAINVLSAGVGVVILAMLILAGIQYTTSRDNPQAVQAAKSRITNALIALAAFVFIYSFLQWIVPGGIF